MNKHIVTRGFVKTFLQLLFILSAAVTSFGHAQVSVHQDSGNSNIQLHYLGTKNNFSRMSLKIKNPQRNLYRITITDTYKPFGEFRNILFEEFNKTPAYATTFVIPDEVKGVEIVVENRKTKVKSTFYANSTYVSNHDVVITKVNGR